MDWLIDWLIDSCWFITPGLREHHLIRGVLNMCQSVSVLSVFTVFTGLQILAQICALIGRQGSRGLWQAEVLPLIPIGVHFINHWLQLPVELQQRLERDTWVCMWRLHRYLVVKKLFINLVPCKVVYRCHLSTPAAGPAAHLYDYGQIWAEERRSSLITSKDGSCHFIE